MTKTKQDPRGPGWAINDPVLQLRHWGKHDTIPLREDRLIVGSQESCSIRLDDGHGLVSREHAIIERQTNVWHVKDLGSTNGTKQDGTVRESFVLAPGDVVEFGRVKLIAESEASVKLHSLLQRFLGWSDVRLPEIDAALSDVREMARLHASLVLRADRRPDNRRAKQDGAFIGGVVRRLHGLIFDESQPLVFHDGKEPGRDALARAVDGLLCIDAKTPPRDFMQLIKLLRLPDVRTRLVICTASSEEVEPLLVQLRRNVTIVIPGLDGRRDEFERLLQTYGWEAAAKLGAPNPSFRPQDSVVLATAVQTLDELEADATRLVAYRNWKPEEAAARRLGITRSALSQWADVRDIPK